MITVLIVKNVTINVKNVKTLMTHVKILVRILQQEILLKIVSVM